MAIVWLLLTIILFAGELILPNLVLLWFGIGALCSLAIAVFDLPIIIQLGVFILVSLTLFSKFTKDIVTSKDNKYSSIMNVREGSVGVVKATIESYGIGVVTIDNQDWSARGMGGIPISEGKSVEVVRSGVILIVRELKNEGSCLKK